MATSRYENKEDENEQFLIHNIINFIRLRMYSDCNIFLFLNQLHSNNDQLK
jgi:hypothetical protein